MSKDAKTCKQIRLCVLFQLLWLIDVELLHEEQSGDHLAGRVAAGKTTTVWCYKSQAVFKSAKVVENASSRGQTRK